MTIPLCPHCTPRVPLSSSPIDFCPRVPPVPLYGASFVTSLQRPQPNFPTQSHVLSQHLTTYTYICIQYLAFYTHDDIIWGPETHPKVDPLLTIYTFFWYCCIWTSGRNVSLYFLPLMDYSLPLVGLQRQRKCRHCSTCLLCFCCWWKTLYKHTL